MQVRAGAQAPALLFGWRLSTGSSTGQVHTGCADPVHSGHRGPGTYLTLPGRDPGTWATLAPVPPRDSSSSLMTIRSLPVQPRLD